MTSATSVVKVLFHTSKILFINCFNYTCFINKKKLQVINSIKKYIYIDSSEKCLTSEGKRLVGTKVEVKSHGRGERRQLSTIIYVTIPIG